MLSLFLICTVMAEPSNEPESESDSDTSSESSGQTTEEAKSEEAKSEEAKSEEAKSEEAKSEEAKSKKSDDASNDTTQSAEEQKSTGETETSSKPTSEQENKKEDSTEKTSKPKLDLSNAEELKNVGKKQLMWLRPLPQRFEQNPYLHVDFTSYCLEWGEVQVGLNTLKAGVLPRTQIGTSIPMWAIGLQNFDAKVNLVRIGPFDLALEGNGISLPTPDFRMSLVGGGLSTSVRILEPWTIHIGSQFMSFSADGLPNLDNINPFILQMSGVDAAGYRDELAEDDVGFDITANVITLRMATDIRINRRDSWVIQAQGIIWHKIDSSSNLNDSEKIPKFLNADEIFALQSEGLSDITQSYVVSIAHQWSWDHSYLRLGAGWSSMSEYSFAPAILQSIDYAWRFGGKSKNREGKIRKGWKENKKKVEQDRTKK